MLRVTTLYASSARATAAYYTRYLSAAPGEVPGQWSGRQAERLGLSGVVGEADLELVLSGRDPTSGTALGKDLVDRVAATGRVVRAVAGFDATFSAPKSVSVWWALTGDPRLVDAHDVAVAAALRHLERFGATTRVRVNGNRQHPDTVGLTVASFRQTTSRADDPQLHTHAVISTKVQTNDGRWLALDARYLKRHQRMLGGLYQSVLRAELTHRFGVAWQPIVNGQAELAGMPDELLEVFSKRAAQVDTAVAAKVADFHAREGRDPTRWERAALTREAAVDTRVHKTGTGVGDLRTRWTEEAAELGWSGADVEAALVGAAREPDAVRVVGVGEVTGQLSTVGSTWGRADVVRVICDLQPPVSQLSGQAWAAELEHAADRVLEACRDLDPPDPVGARRHSDGRSVWIEPVATQFTSDAILAEEERILTWALDTHLDPPEPSPTVNGVGLDVMQADAATAIAGHDRLVLVVGPAGAGKTTMVRAAVNDITAAGGLVVGLTPTAKAARVLETETGMPTRTVAKFLHDTNHPTPGPRFAELPPGATLVVDEAGMIGTPSLAALVELADRHRWRLVLVGDPYQLQAVGRGGLFVELCARGRVHELTRIHRFTHPWEAHASLHLRAGNPAGLDAYEAHDRITAGTIDDHLTPIAAGWLEHTGAGRTVAVTATTNTNVDALNAAIQHARLATGDIDPTRTAPIGGGETACLGDVVVTRRNDRSLGVRNRETWTVTAVRADGTLTVTPTTGHGDHVLPADYAREHVRLGYAVTEHGRQGDTVDIGLTLISPATTHRGLYVAATRGRHTNQFHVITSAEPDAPTARDILDAVLASDRADVPAVTQRRHLAHQPPRPGLTLRAPIPDWVDRTRVELRRQALELVAGVRQRADQRTQAAVELAALQPTLTAARQAWDPYAHHIHATAQHLRGTLRPAMWHANHDALHAARGHRRRAQDRADIATRAVHDAEAAIAAIHTQGATEEHILDDLTAQARRLAELANTSPATNAFERYEAEQLGHIEQLLDSLDTWCDWATGHPVRPRDLADALDRLVDAAHRGRSDELADRLLDGADWLELGGASVGWLEQRSDEIAVDRWRARVDRHGFGVDVG